MKQSVTELLGKPVSEAKSEKGGNYAASSVNIVIKTTMYPIQWH